MGVGDVVHTDLQRHLSDPGQRHRDEDQSDQHLPVAFLRVDRGGSVSAPDPALTGPRPRRRRACRAGRGGPSVCRTSKEYRWSWTWYTSWLSREWTPRVTQYFPPVNGSGPMPEPDAPLPVDAAERQALARGVAAEHEVVRPVVQRERYDGVLDRLVRLEVDLDREELARAAAARRAGRRRATAMPRGSRAPLEPSSWAKSRSCLRIVRRISRTTSSGSPLVRTRP